MNCKKFNSIDYIAGGMLLYTLSVTVVFFYLPQYISWGVDVLALLITFYGVFRRGFNYGCIDKDILFVLSIMLLYSLFVILQSLYLKNFNPPHIITQNYYALPLLLPLISMLGIRKPEEMKKIYHYLFTGCVVCVIHFLINGRNFVFNTTGVLRGMDADADLGLYEFLRQVTLGQYLIVPLFVYYAIRKVENHYHFLLISFALILSTIITALFGRRMATATILIMFFMPLFVNFVFGKHKFLYFIIMAVFLIGLIDLFDKIADLFPILSERLTDNTREDFQKQVFRQYEGLDFLFGRGVSATYQDSLQGERGHMEAGYLSIIMREGIVYLLLYIYVLLVPAYRALIKGKNIFIKASGLFLVFECAQIAVAGMRTWSLPFMMVFIAISQCSDKRLRTTKDFEIFKL